MKFLTQRQILLLNKELLTTLRKRLTIKEIAKVCGVSVSLISTRLKDYKIKGRPSKKNKIL